MGKVDFRSYYIDFNNKEEMYRFILLFRDLFTSWCEGSMKEDCYDYDWTKFKGQEGFKTWNQNRYNMMKEGYIISGNKLTIHLRPDDFKNNIKYLLDKGTVDRQHRRTYRYVSEKVKS